MKNEEDTPPNNKGGRKKGSKNRPTGKIKIEFTETLLDNLKKELRTIHLLSEEKRISVLTDMLKYVLPNAQLTHQESEIQKMLYVQMLPQYRRFSSYFSLLPQEKKISALMRLLKYFSPPRAQHILLELLEQLKRMKGGYK